MQLPQKAKLTNRPLLQNRSGIFATLGARARAAKSQTVLVLRYATPRLAPPRIRQCCVLLGLGFAV